MKVGWKSVPGRWTGVEEVKFTLRIHLRKKFWLRGYEVLVRDMRLGFGSGSDTGKVRVFLLFDIGVLVWFVSFKNEGSSSVWVLFYSYL